MGRLATMIFSVLKFRAVWSFRFAVSSDYKRASVLKPPCTHCQILDDVELYL